MRSEITGRRKERVKNRRSPVYTSIHRRYLLTLGKYLRRGKISRVGIKELSKRTHVWKSTFYDHFTHMDDAIEQFWLMMKPELIKLKELVGSHKLPLVKIYSRILLLIYHNREYYDVVVSCQNYTALYQIVEIFQPLITASWSKYNTQDYKRALTLFSWEFAGRICCWGKFEKFDFDKVSVHARELAKLSENATQRLA